jgi:hypothetical protein
MASRRVRPAAVASEFEAASAAALRLIRGGADEVHCLERLATAPGQ